MKTDGAMKRPTHRLRTLGLCCAVPVLAALVFVDLVAVARGASASAQGQDSSFRNKGETKETKKGNKGDATLF